MANAPANLKEDLAYNNAETDHALSKFVQGLDPKVREEVLSHMSNLTDDQQKAVWGLVRENYVAEQKDAILHDPEIQL